MKSKIRQLCENNTELTSIDIDIIEELANKLGTFCELTGDDLFIDCFLPGGEKGIVIAHGRPVKGSQYKNNIQGDQVLPENEPIVFYTMKTGKAIRDAKALSQEGRWVLQRTVPIKNDERIIGVLIKESDVTEDIRAKRKLRQIRESSVNNTLPNIIKEENSHDVVDRFAMVQEMHHRIKNNLQVISSILSMQERRSFSTETKDILKDNINRINNIAHIHETLMSTGENDIDVYDQIKNLAEQMINFACGEGKEITINVSGDRIKINSAKLIPIQMVINELIMNSVRHGYPEKEYGTIEIDLISGESYSTIIVRDDGIGIDNSKKNNMKRGGLGGELIKMMITEDLKGSLHIDSDSSGTSAWFDFSMF